MDHRLSNYFRLSKAAENIQHISRLIFRCDQRVWRDGGHSCVDQRRRILAPRECLVVSQRARKLIKRYAGDRTTSESLFRLEGFTEHFHHNARFYRAENDIRPEATAPALCAYAIAGHAGAATALSGRV